MGANGGVITVEMVPVGHAFGAAHTAVGTAGTGGTAENLAQVMPEIVSTQEFFSPLVVSDKAGHVAEGCPAAAAQEATHTGDGHGTSSTKPFVRMKSCAANTAAPGATIMSASSCTECCVNSTASQQAPCAHVKAGKLKALRRDALIDHVAHGGVMSPGTARFDMLALSGELEVLLAEVRFLLRQSRDKPLDLSERELVRWLEGAELVSPAATGSSVEETEAEHAIAAFQHYTRTALLPWTTKATDLSGENRPEVFDFFLDEPHQLSDEYHARMERRSIERMYPDGIENLVARGLRRSASLSSTSSSSVSLSEVVVAGAPAAESKVGDEKETLEHGGAAARAQGHESLKAEVDAFWEAAREADAGARVDDVDVVTPRVSSSSRVRSSDAVQPGEMSDGVVVSDGGIVNDVSVAHSGEREFVAVPVSPARAEGAPTAAATAGDGGAMVSEGIPAEIVQGFRTLEDFCAQWPADDALEQRYSRVRSCNAGEYVTLALESTPRSIGSYDDRSVASSVRSTSSQSWMAEISGMSVAERHRPWGRKFQKSASVSTRGSRSLSPRMSPTGSVDSAESQLYFPSAQSPYSSYSGGMSVASSASEGSIHLSQFLNATSPALTGCEEYVQATHCDC